MLAKRANVINAISVCQHGGFKCCQHSTNYKCSETILRSNDDDKLWNNHNVRAKLIRESNADDHGPHQHHAPSNVQHRDNDPDDVQPDDSANDDDNECTWHDSRDDNA